MHIYAFGSVCRGEIRANSDIDLLAIVNGIDERFDLNLYSIYSYNRLTEIWNEGNPFAWHLAKEAKLLFSSDGSDFLDSLKIPQPYQSCRQDCEKFYRLFSEACRSFVQNETTKIFDLSMVFLGIRNFATCFSLGQLNTPDFSRHSALRLGSSSLMIPSDAYEIFERARILCTRGLGTAISKGETNRAAHEFRAIEEWMETLLLRVPTHEQ